MFGDVRGGNYGAVGQSLQRQNEAIYKINAEASPNYSEIANEAIKGRSKERRAAIAAEAQIHRVGMKEMATQNIYKKDAELEKELADIKKPAKRFAGIVGAAGTLVGAGVLKKFSDEAAERDAERDAKYDDFLEKTKQMYDRERPELLQLPDPPKRAIPNLKDPRSSTNTGGGTNTSVPKQTSGPGRVVSQQEGVQLLIDQGMDPENARIGGAVMMAESRGRTKALNNRGEYSLGLWQHNNDTGEDRRAFYGISDWSELEDPVTNARATYRLWKRQGGWTPWGAYTNGSYKNFL